METETESPQPTHPAREDPTIGVLFALIINLLLSISFLFVTAQVSSDLSSVEKSSKVRV